jgi:predicted Zn-dependent protease
MSPRGLRRLTGALQFTVLLVVLLASAPLAKAQADGTARAPASGPTSTSQLPTLGDGSGLGAGAERRLGDRIAHEICRDPDYLDDPVLVENVDATWQSLLAAARSRGDVSPEPDEQFAWEIILGRDRTINAFALPGGYLGLHLGLNGEVTNRDELVSVLAGACAPQGLSLRATRAEAEAHQVARMDYAAALDRFKAALTLMRNGQSASIDPIDASIIDNRARAGQLLHRAAEASP